MNIPAPVHPRSADWPLRRLLLSVVYDGTDFCGWQKQEPPDATPLRTAQGVMESKLRRFFSDPTLRLDGASRTDSGVHARGQAALCQVRSPIPIERLAHALTGRLPEDLAVTATVQVGPDFNLWTDVHSKQYRYRIATGMHRPVLDRRMVHHLFCDLDISRMQQAAKRLIGTLDLAAFAAAGHGRQSTIRTLFDCHIEIPGPGLVDLVIAGSGFLYNTVRIVAGTLCEIGRGRFQPEQITRAIDAGDRNLAGPTFPPQALCLEWISYDQPPEPGFTGVVPPPVPEVWA